MAPPHTSVIWQPDRDAASCTLCSNKFTFFNRRHHCRKCGRVVCGDCSDQQIRYFSSTMIVGPSGKLSKPSPYDTYRTCDECVEEIRMIRRALFEERGSIDLESPGDAGAPVPDAGAAGANTGSGSGPGGPTAARFLNHDNDSTSSVTKYLGARTQTRLVRSSTHSSVMGTPHLGGTGSAAPDDQSDHNLCPVCAINLSKVFPGGTNDEFEAFKEAHICDCLTQFDFNLDHQRSPTADGTRTHTRNKMLVYNIPPIPRPQFESLPGDSSSQPSGSDTFVVGSDTSTHSTVHMSEKFVARECVICLEDLKPGDKVGRLECLCVFHYKCIKDWFNKKGHGECPVHFLHK